MLIAITGNLGSGKSTLRRIFERQGHATYDSDEIVSELYKKKEIIDLIGKEFGKEVISGGTVDRKLLAKMVFNSSIKLKKLDQLIHPLVARKIQLINHADSLVFVEVPLLFEAHMEKLFDKIILTKAPHEVAKERAVKRGFAEEEFEKRVAAQFTADRLSKRAHYLIETTDSLSVLSEKAAEISKELSGSQNWRGF